MLARRAAFQFGFQTGGFCFFRGGSLFGGFAGLAFDFTRPQGPPVAAAKMKLAALVREGLECKGEDIEFTEEWFDKRMDDVRAEFERRRRREAEAARQKADRQGAGRS